MPRRNKIKLVAPVIAAVVLMAAAAETLSRPKPSDAEPYHARIRAVADVLKAKWDRNDASSRGILEADGKEWKALAREVPESAITLLNPNVIYSRMFSDGEESADVLIVHCKDARDIYGHYPPNCYPSSGYTLDEARNFDDTVDGVEIHGRMYQFSQQGRTILVYNFIPMPGGRIMRDMTDVKRAAWDYTKSFHGGAQVQVLFSGTDTSEKRRREIFELLVGAHMPLIREIIGEIK